MAYFCPHRQRNGRVSQPRVFLGVPCNCKSGSSTAKAHSRVGQVRLDHGQGTRVCLVDV
ncbi:Extracellular matrix FRAS1 [Gossypium arboreum]|uniref:Extracellular matrix FRAS1 n=1 Tax=Gossypium arboreum TaxID=29729 RepID=A0A0B0NPJ5_GOSAR|nr:Extracellular matrix FRAS1 [Gossypium arboreum]